MDGLSDNTNAKIMYLIKYVLCIELDMTLQSLNTADTPRYTHHLTYTIPSFTLQLHTFIRVSFVFGVYQF